MATHGRMCSCTVACIAGRCVDARPPWSSPITARLSNNAPAAATMPRLAEIADARTFDRRVLPGAAPATSGSDVSIASWIRSGSAPQNVSALAGARTTAASSALSAAQRSATSVAAADRSALGPKGTSSSGGPNQSRGKRRIVAPSPGASLPLRLSLPSGGSTAFADLFSPAVAMTSSCGASIQI